MRKILAEINVDEEKIKEVSENECLEDAIRGELGWLEDSGMYVKNWNFEELSKEEFDLLKEVEELNNNTPDGVIRDADTILADLLQNVDNEFTGFAQDIFNIYKNSQDKNAVCQMFYEFTGIEFENYLKQCKAVIARSEKALDSKIQYEKNTRIFYLYRDASNYKVTNEVVVHGTMTEEQKAIIMDSLDCGEYFIPSQVGLPEVRFGSITEDDHCWFELTEDDFVETTDLPSVSCDVNELVNAFHSHKGKWDDTVFPELQENESLDDVIQSCNQPHDEKSECQFEDTKDNISLEL